MKTKRILEGSNIIIEDTLGNRLLTIQEKIISKKDMLVKVDGDLTSDVIHDFEDELVSASIVCKSIYLDLEDVSYISNSVIKFLLQLQHMMEDKNGELIIKNVRDDIMTVFKEMGLEDMFYFE